MSTTVPTSETQARWYVLLQSVVETLVLPCWPLVTLPRFFLLYDRSCPAARVTGTILCPEGGRVSLCLQDTPSSSPFFLLDLPVSTEDFTNEVSTGTCRVTLECSSPRDAQYPQHSAPRMPQLPLLLGMSQWAVCVNGHRWPGWATRRAVVAEKEEWALRAVGMVTTGVGTLMQWGSLPAAPSRVEAIGSRWCKYVRGNFERVVGSDDSVSYPFVDPTGLLDGQDVSFFFLRS